VIHKYKTQFYFFIDDIHLQTLNIYIHVQALTNTHSWTNFVQIS